MRVSARIPQICLEGPRPVKKLLIRFCLVAFCLSTAFTAASAQKNVHAVSGTVSAVMPNFRMIEVTSDDGTASHFQWMRKADGAVNFDKNISADSTSGNDAAVKGDHIIVYYFGDGDPRTAVAIHSLGQAAITETEGTVVKFDKHEHTLTIHPISGADVTFHIDPKTVGDTANNGVQENFKFEYDKGQYVRVTATGDAGNATAWLIAPPM